jgi:hypothetical protein
MDEAPTGRRQVVKHIERMQDLSAPRGMINGVPVQKRSIFTKLREPARIMEQTHQVSGFHFLGRPTGMEGQCPAIFGYPKTMIILQLQ